MLRFGTSSRSRRSNARNWLPQALRDVLRRARDRWRRPRQQRELWALAPASPKKIVIGSAGSRFKGWVSTDENVLDLLQEETWSPYFSRDDLDAILAEHVWEHLDAGEAKEAARICFQFLKPGGHLRVAVPDGLHPDPSYIEAVRPGGTGAGAEDHKVLYTYASLRDLFVDTGFDVRLQEYFDEHGRFHSHEWDPADGMILRSKRFDSRNSPGQLFYTSIILDALKPDPARAPSSSGAPAAPT